MPEDMDSAFLQAIVDYVRDPTMLDSILASLDEVQRHAYTAGQNAIHP